MLSVSRINRNSAKLYRYYPLLSPFEISRTAKQDVLCVRHVYNVCENSFSKYPQMSILRVQTVRACDTQI